jgi:hypothetical protein
MFRTRAAWRPPIYLADRFSLLTAVFDSITPTVTVTRIKYSGGIYIALAQSADGATAYVSTSSDLVSWITPVAVANTILYDAAYNDLINNTLILIGESAGAARIFRTTASVSTLTNVTPGGLSIPKYIDWCSFFPSGSFQISAATNRAYSNATGSTWTVANYSSSTYEPAGLVFIPSLGAYYDIRMQKTVNGELIIYRGTTAASSSAFITESAYGSRSYSDCVIFHNQAINNIFVLSRIASGASTLIGASMYTTAGVGTAGAAIGLPVGKFVGAGYFPSYDQLLIQDAAGNLSKFAKLRPPGTLEATWKINTTYSFDTVTSALAQQGNRLIFGPAGLISMNGPGQISLNV